MSSEDNEEDKKKKKKRAHEEDQAATGTKRQKEETEEDEEAEHEVVIAPTPQVPAVPVATMPIVQVAIEVKDPSRENAALTHYRGLQPILDQAMQREWPSDVSRICISYLGCSDHNGNFFEPYWKRRGLGPIYEYEQTNLGVLYEETKHQLHSIGIIDRKDVLDRGLLMPYISTTSDHQLCLQLDHEEWRGPDLPVEGKEGAFVLDNIIKNGDPSKYFMLELNRTDNVHLRALAIFDEATFALWATFGPFRSGDETIHIYSNIERDFHVYSSRDTPAPLEVLTNYYIKGSASAVRNVPECYYGMPRDADAEIYLSAASRAFCCEFRIVNDSIIFSPESQEMKHGMRSGKRQHNEYELDITGALTYSVRCPSLLSQRSDIRVFHALITANGIELFEITNGKLVTVDHPIDVKYELLSTLDYILRHLLYVSKSGIHDLNVEARTVGLHLIEKEDFIGPFDIIWKHAPGLMQFLKVVGNIFLFKRTVHDSPDF